jgi:hypothetical protein
MLRDWLVDYSRKAGASGERLNAARVRFAKVGPRGCETSARKAGEFFSDSDHSNRGPTPQLLFELIYHWDETLRLTKLSSGHYMRHKPLPCGIVNATDWEPLGTDTQETGNGYEA